MAGRLAFSLIAGVLAATTTACALGQEVSSRARLDDFALPATDRSTGVQQLSDGPRAVPAQPVGERDVSAPPNSMAKATSSAPVVQVTATGEAIRPAQRDPAQARSARGVSDLSARQDSAPRATAALTGDDSCDPQNRRANRPTGRDTAESERCRRILELRAAEFDAPAAPVLSAEQRITVEQQRRDAGQGLSTPDMSTRVLARGTDAESRSSQELASLVLSPTDGDPAVPPRTLENPALDTGLSELLQTLVVQLGGQPRP